MKDNSHLVHRGKNDLYKPLAPGFEFRNRLLASHGKKQPLKTPKTWIYSPIDYATQKNEISHLCEWVNNKKNSWRESPATKHWKIDFPTMGKNEETTKTWMKTHMSSQKCEEEEDVNAWWESGEFLGSYFPIKPKHVFLKWVPFPIRNWPPYLAHSHAITNSATLDDWAQKTKWVVDSFMGFPFDIWIFPIGSRVWIPPPFLVKSCPHLFNVALT